MIKHEDKELHKMITSGDLKQRDQALAALYQQHFPLIQQLVLRNKGSKDEAKDVFQDGIIVLYNQLLSGAFEGRSSIKTYLYAICRRLWMRKLTRTHPTEDIIDNLDYVETSENVLDCLIGTEREQCVADLLQKMGSECHKLLRNFYFDKLSMKQIVAQMQITNVQVAKNKKMKCMKRLRKLVLESSHYMKILKP